VRPRIWSCNLFIIITWIAKDGGNLFAHGHNLPSDLYLFKIFSRNGLVSFIEGFVKEKEKKKEKKKRKKENRNYFNVFSFLSFTSFCLFFLSFLQDNIIN